MHSPSETRGVLRVGCDYVYVYDHLVLASKVKGEREIRQVLMSGADGLRAVFANYPWKHPASRVPSRINRSAQVQQAKLGRRPLPFEAGLCVQQ